jgi:hypothetical protein
MNNQKNMLKYEESSWDNIPLCNFIIIDGL